MSLETVGTIELLVADGTGHEALRRAVNSLHMSLQLVHGAECRATHWACAFPQVLKLKNRHKTPSDVEMKTGVYYTCYVHSPYKTVG